MQERESSTEHVNESDLAGGLGLEAEVVARRAETPPEGPLAPPTSPDPQGQALYDQQLATEREIRRLEGELRHAQAAYEAAVVTPVGAALDEIDAHVATLAAAEQRVATLRQQLSMQQHRYVLLGDALFSHRQQGRGRVESRFRAEIDEITRADVEVKAKIAEHLNAVQDLEREREALEQRLRPLTREIERVTLRTNRVLKVNVQLAAPWRPPADALVKPSAWRRFVERARAAGLETIDDVFVDEMTGAVHSPRLDRQSASPTEEGVNV